MVKPIQYQAPFESLWEYIQYKHQNIDTANIHNQNIDTDSKITDGEHDDENYRRSSTT